MCASGQRCLFEAVAPFLAIDGKFGLASQLDRVYIMRSMHHNARCSEEILNAALANGNRRDGFSRRYINRSDRWQR